LIVEESTMSVKESRVTLQESSLSVEESTMSVQDSTLSLKVFPLRLEGSPFSLLISAMSGKDSTESVKGCLMRPCISALIPSWDEKRGQDRLEGMRDEEKKACLGFHSSLIAAALIPSLVLTH
jgi:hypothetical protein